MQQRPYYRLKFFLLALVFVVPIAVSSLLYHFHDHFSFKTLNKGTLIQPSLIVESEMQAVKGWKVIYAPLHCAGSDADKITFTLHQLRKALGKEAHRVELVLWVNGNCVMNDSHDFKQITLTSEQERRLQAFLKFPFYDHIYLVDPHNNLFMYYSASVNPMLILKDMKKVLEVSQIG